MGGTERRTLCRVRRDQRGHGRGAQTLGCTTGFKKDEVALSVLVSATATQDLVAASALQGGAGVCASGGRERRVLEHVRGHLRGKTCADPEGAAEYWVAAVGEDTWW